MKEAYIVTTCQCEIEGYAIVPKAVFDFLESGKSGVVPSTVIKEVNQNSLSWAPLEEGTESVGDSSMERHSSLELKTSGELVPLINKAIKEGATFVGELEIALF